MSLVVLVSPDPNWHVPMDALLRQVGLNVEVAQDALDALILLRTEPLPKVVLGPAVSEPDVHTLTDAAWRRHGPRFQPHVVGELRSLPIDDPHRPLVHHPEPMGFLTIRDQLSTDPGLRTPPSTQSAVQVHERPAAQPTAPVTPETAPEESWIQAWQEEPPTTTPAHVTANEWVNLPAPAAPPDTALAKARAEEIQPIDIERLLRLARQETYYRLLGLGPEAGLADIDRAARALLLLFDSEHVDAYVHASSRDALLEIEAAVRDARAVLSSPSARRCYDAQLRSQTLPAHAARNTLR